VDTQQATRAITPAKANIKARDKVNSTRLHPSSRAAMARLVEDIPDKAVRRRPGGIEIDPCRSDFMRKRLSWEYAGFCILGIGGYLKRVRCP
jgi:hypothetical protein